MSISFPCVHCGKRLKAAAEQEGKWCKCTRCGRVMTISGAAAGKVPWRRSRLVVGASVVGGLLVLAGCLVLFFWTRPTDVEQKLADLKTSDADARAQAVVWLAEADVQDAYRGSVTAALEPILFEGDWHGSIPPDLLLRAYLHWADQGNVPALIRMVVNPTLPAWDAAKATQVMLALGKLQDERAIEALANQLASPALHVAAVSSLKLMGPRAEPAVLAYLFDNDPAVRQRAGDVLAAYHTRPETIAAEALNQLKSGNPEVRLGAAAWFAENPPSNDLQKAQGAKLLTGLLDELSPPANAVALRGLKMWATRDSLPALVSFARRQAKAGPGSQAAANNGPLIDVLAHFPDPTAAEAIALMLREPAERGRAVQALLKLGSVSAAAVLPYVDHPDPAVARAARGLARDLAGADAGQLDQILADVAGASKVRARTALERLARLRPDEQQRTKVSRALNAPLLDPDRGIREAALRAVRVWVSPENTATLAKLLGGFQVRSRDDAASQEQISLALVAIGPAVQDAMIPLLTSPDGPIRSQAARILSVVGTGHSVEPLRQAAAGFFDRDRFFFNRAQEAMANIEARSDSGVQGGQ